MKEILKEHGLIFCVLIVILFSIVDNMWANSIKGEAYAACLKASMQDTTKCKQP